MGRKILSVLIAITVCVIGFYIVQWVLQLLGLNPPRELITACFVLIALVSIGGAFFGKFDSWWGPGPNL